MPKKHELFEVLAMVSFFLQNGCPADASNDYEWHSRKKLLARINATLECEYKRANGGRWTDYMSIDERKSMRKLDRKIAKLGVRCEHDKPNDELIVLRKQRYMIQNRATQRSVRQSV